MNPPRPVSEEDLTPEPSDAEGEDAEGEEEVDLDGPVSINNNSAWLLLTQ